MTSLPASSPPASSGPPIPQGFNTIEEIQNEQMKAGTFVNILGFVKDYQPPVKTRGTDFKCTFEVMDLSVQYACKGIKVIIFWEESKMPRISGVRDAVIARNVKVQMWSGTISLLAHMSSEFHVLPASRIPQGPAGVPNAQWISTPQSAKKPHVDETTYVTRAFLNTGEMSMPSSQEFQACAAQAMNVRDKFSLLKDVKPGNFYNLLGEVIRIFDGSPSTITMYLSDYTAHKSFYEYVWQEDGQASDDNGRDEYGNRKYKPKESKAWPGPYGKMTIQLTLYDAHADFVRDNVKDGQWVLLRNVHIKFGTMGNCLEGFLRGDPNQYENTIRVEVMKQKEDKDENDTRWKDAIRRKLDCSKKFSKQKQEFLEQAASLGEKRKRDGEPTTLNSKKRRQERRAAAERKVVSEEARIAEKLDLNANIKCSYPDLPTIPIPRILEPCTGILDNEGSQEVTFPFVVRNYRANVRVVAYFPLDVTDFAVGRRISEYDMLSDYSGGEDSGSEEFRRSWKSGKGAPAKVWEWRFALQVEDANSKAGKERTWLMVDNAAAQGLLDMDAMNLRSREGQDVLRDLKERMCIIWGDLEEQTSASRKTIEPPKPTSLSLEAEPPSSPTDYIPGSQPNVDSDDENDFTPVKAASKSTKMTTALNETDLNVSLNNNSIQTANQPKDLPIHNKAFTCCIKQYGVKVQETDMTKANAGDGKRWERKFGMFGVVIV